MTAVPSDVTIPELDYEHCESLYWVFTQRCNDVCAHCYNLSGPRGATISVDECLSVIANLPPRIDRLILSGGEPFADREKLYRVLEALDERYGGRTQVMLQTNGDLLNEDRLDAVLERGVSRIDVASMDRYHKLAGTRREELTRLFLSRGMLDEATGPLITKDDYLQHGTKSFGFWGANENFWIGGNWARGRAMQTGVWHKDGTHNFCAVLSGGRGFLGGSELPQEISIQLWRISPCCPGTRDPIGDARSQNVAEVMRRVSRISAYRKINNGDPYALAEHIGVTRDEGVELAKKLGNVCLACDELCARVKAAGGL